MYVILKVDPSIGVVDAINSGQFTGFNLIMLKFAFITENFGGTLFGFAIPMFAAFTANSIGGKLAFPAGFIGGLVSTNPILALSLVDGIWVSTKPVPSGFIGAFIIAFVAGYTVKWLNKKIKVSPNWLAFKSTLLIPIIAALVVMVSMRYLITPFGGFINEAMRGVLTAAGKGGEIVYSVVLSMSTAIDLGGPINKAAGFIALQLTTDRMLPITARTIAIVVPSIGLGLATIIDRRVVGRHVFDKQFYAQGKTAIFLAFMGISEGAIPFALERPKIAIPSYMVGAVSGATIGVLLGAVQWFPESAIWAWPLIKNFHAYALGILIGSVITALLTIFLRNNEIKKGTLVVDSND
jgi:fructose-like PTS system EIIC or EIIBC or EIIABC component